ncbi:transient receptor potential cation channel subfamily A member 1-like [Dreissena polymorpha]|uniref:transient receptor potential cation channel subfamily A member 1-like n=1 Tax=Dreissena polymorpha TaxID=45954 RepID=UPI00226471B3|nr:transient receptor potential cation channel subfamily A member 1-like [Dreissena polymorpha]
MSVFKLRKKNVSSKKESNGDGMTHQNLLGISDRVIVRKGSPNLPETKSKPRRNSKQQSKSIQRFVADVNRTAGDVASDVTLLCAAAKGNLEEFQRLYENDPSRLSVRDGKGLCPIHKAAEFGRLNILQFIVDQAGDLNMPDKLLNTPLHVSVRTEQVGSIQFLLDHGADPTVANDDQMAPLHLAVDINAKKSLKALLSHAKVDPNLKGEKGMNALHYCAYKDRAECAKILLENGAKPCQKCDNGFFPINIAGKCAAAKTLEILIQHVEKLGYKREDILTFTDKENNMPLHGAVNSGDLKAVQVCLSAGAPVDAKQEDSSTPLHFAAAQGSVDMVRLMHEVQPERFKAALHMQDVLRMTPLHRAALFDHVAVVKLLLEHGSDIDARDTHERTPLILASTKGGWRTVHLLLESGADINLKDKENRNFLHLAIKNGVPINNFGCAIIKGVKNLLNEKDDLGCTPLHYASKEGHLVAIDDLISLGAVINAKDNEKKSPLHFAARYGRYNTCRRLLDSPMGPNIINETDGDGLSALHFAAENGHTKIIHLLMQKGAYVTRDNMDNSPLHLAASYGYTRSVKLLLTVYFNLMDCANKAGRTALHMAAHHNHPGVVGLLLSLGANMLSKDKNEESFMDIALREGHSEVAFAVIRHERWEEALKMCSKQYGTIMNGMVQCLPDVCMAALDRCQIPSKHDRKSRDYSVHYNFKYLQCPLRYLKGKDKDGRDHTPMLALNTMVKHGRVQCLSHPVSEAYLNMKWRAYGAWFHMTNLVIYIIYLALLTVLVTTCTFSLEREISNNSSSSVNASVSVNNVTSSMPLASVSRVNVKEYKFKSCEITTMHRICVCIVFIFCILNILKEIVQMVQQKKKYFKDMTNFLEWILYSTTLVYIAPFVMSHAMYWQWQAGAIAVFLAWFNCLLFLRRFDFFGIYIVMFLEILRTLLQVLFVFSILLMAFALAFFTLLNIEDNRAFSSPTQSLLRTAMMMLELDFMASFNDPYTDGDVRTLYFGDVTILLLVVFVLLMPILLMNLLIGLAVGDIESVQKNATLKRLAMQVELHTSLERRLPFRLLDMVDKSEYTYYPNKCSGRFDGVSILQLMSRMFTLSDYMNDEDGDKSLNHQTHLYEELYKQKMRMRDISTALTKQYDMMRLIVQKMEIQTEDDNRDEGDNFEMSNPIEKGSKWAPAKHNLLRQNAIVAHWKQSMTEDPCGRTQTPVGDMGS